MEFPSTPSSARVWQNMPVLQSSPLSTVPLSSALQPPSEADIPSEEQPDSDMSLVDEEESIDKDMRGINGGRHQMLDEQEALKQWEHLLPSERRSMRQIESILRRRRWTIGQFLSAWTRHGHGEQRLALLQDGLRHPVLRQILPGALGCQELANAVAQRIRREWSDLVGQGIFCRELPSVDIEQLDPMAAHNVLLAHAPQWVALLLLLLCPRRCDKLDQQGPAVSASLAGRMILITTICLGVFARGATVGFRLLLAYYLQGAGLTRRGNEVLAGFGAVPTYKYVNRGIIKMAERGKVSSYFC